MSIYKGTTLIASGLPVAGFPLFYHTFQDHVLNNTSWLRADTFSWQSGAVYVSAYNHLVDDIDGITAETETISGTTITFYRATDGHKIVLADQESNVSAIYTATGVAWYYILDTTNQRFKLPQSKWNFVGSRDAVGTYVAESLPNITGDAYLAANSFGLVYDSAQNTGAFKIGTSTGLGKSSAVGASDGASLGFDASLASSAYQNDAPVQQRATQAYLYFYVGNTVQDQTTVDVGQITDALNGKVDLPTNKTQADVDFVVESYQSGASWYRVYKSGWCEQGGTATASQSISLLKTYSDTNYTAVIAESTTTTYGNGVPLIVNKTASGFSVHPFYGDFGLANWYACGYIA